MSEHTPTPWALKFNSSQMGSLNPDYEMVSVDGVTIASDTPYYPTSPNQQDAAFIVSAVNSHDSLLAICHRIELEFSDAKHTGSVESQLLLMAREAIAKSNGLA